MNEQQPAGRWMPNDVRHLLGRTSFAVDEHQVIRLQGLSRDEAVELLLREARQAPLPAATFNRRQQHPPCKSMDRPLNHRSAFHGG